MWIWTPVCIDPGHLHLKGCLLSTIGRDKPMIKLNNWELVLVRFQTGAKHSAPSGWNVFNLAFYIILYFLSDSQGLKWHSTNLSFKKYEFFQKF